MLIVPIPMRHIPIRTPGQLAGHALAVVIVVGGFIACVLAGKAAGTPGVAAVILGALVAIGAVIRHQRTVRQRAYAAFLDQFTPPARYAARVLTAPLPEAVQPFRAAGLPPVYRRPSAVDPGIWPIPGGLAVRVPLLSGMKVQHYTAAAPALAFQLGAATVTPHREGRTVVLEILT